MLGWASYSGTQHLSLIPVIVERRKWALTSGLTIWSDEHLVSGPYYGFQPRSKLAEEISRQRMPKWVNDAEVNGGTVKMSSGIINVIKPKLRNWKTVCSNAWTCSRSRTMQATFQIKNYSKTNYCFKTVYYKFQPKGELYIFKDFLQKFVLRH